MKFTLVILTTVLFLVIFSMTIGETLAQSESETPKRMTPELLWKLGRLGESAVCGDGTKIAYTVKRYDMAENKGFTSLFLLETATGTEKPLLKNWKSIASVQWVKSAAGERLWFEGTPADAKNEFVEDQNGNSADTTDEASVEKQSKSNEESESADAKNQAYFLGVTSNKPKQVTHLKDGIANLKVTTDGNKIAFCVDVKMDLTPAQIYPDLPKADARIIDGLMYRHWNAWHDYAYSHLHVAEIDRDGVAGEAVDLMKDLKADCPVPPFGGGEQFAWSPDGSELAFTMKNVQDWAQSTNSDVYLIAADGKSAARNITVANQGYDNNPTYSPDGRWLAFASMQRPGFEADRNRLMLFDRNSKSFRELTAGLDQSVGHAIWLPDSSGLLFSSDDRGATQVFQIDVTEGKTKQISDGHFNWDPVAILSDGQTLIATQASMVRPEELVQLSILESSNDGGSKKLSGINDDIYRDLELPSIEERFVPATDGEKIQCWVIYPPGFDPQSDKKWPMLTYCQGGPQSQIGQWFSYRWNFHLMASQGYIVLAPNRRGLPGFGQEWNDEISGDWGGQAMRDLISSTDNMLAEPYVDSDHVAAVGASFGGYSVYWLMGNSADRFCTMVAHCGVFNLESMYGSTEELFFVNHDLGGPYWKSDEINSKYQEFSPHRFVKNWKTPLLVIHNQKDFRVPVTQGMEAFTAAQVQGVPSRFLYFPEEGHWVQSPQNSILWQRVFFDWLDRYCKTGS